MGVEGAGNECLSKGVTVDWVSPSQVLYRRVEPEEQITSLITEKGEVQTL